MTSGISWWCGVSADDRKGHTPSCASDRSNPSRSIEFHTSNCRSMILNDDRTHWPGGEQLCMGVVVMVQEYDPTEASRRNGASSGSIADP